MSRHSGCPPWCREHTSDATGLWHSTVLGDVRLTRITVGATSLTICSVRRRLKRTAGDSDQLLRSVMALSDQVRREVEAISPSTGDEAQPAPVLAPA